MNGNYALSPVRFGRMRGAAGRCPAIFFILLAMFVLSTVGASAQTCSADSQCANGGRSTATCVGDTLVVRRSICAGRCQDVEERRQSCGSRILGTITCQGNIAIRQEGGCNAISMSCDSRTDREVCVKTCSCRANRLIVSTGQCSSGAGCNRAVIECKNGCSCSPEARCN